MLFLVHLSTGSVALSFTEIQDGLMGSGDSAKNVVRLVRLPQALTALLAGAGLAASGLLMQTLFRNPLAGPSVLGISSGASLGVALLMLSQPLWSMVPIPRDAALVIAALIGSMGVLALVLLADRRIGDGVTLLIVGLMVGYICSALISVLQVASPDAALKGFVLWGMGSFAGVGPERMGWLVVPVLLGISASVYLVKSLNALLMGEDCIATMGIPCSVHRHMWTARHSCGYGRGFLWSDRFPWSCHSTLHVHSMRTSDHTRLMPATLLCGAVLALLCDVIIKLPGVQHAIPLNAVTSLLGAPVVAWVLFSGKRWARSIMKTILHTADLAVGHGKKTILKGIDLSLNLGGGVAMIGVNDSGKSTLLSATQAGATEAISGGIAINRYEHLFKYDRNGLSTHY
ncbi:MAG: iron chelate uptake ABC transporter family permease subunit [Flavobacteriales bacterium]|nr:iron chelate uptake ABC transporter family permease subunit [Flavobacteriales bacterium]